MKDNTAYEQTNLGVQSHPQAHPPKGVAQQQQEDNIYEMYANA